MKFVCERHPSLIIADLGVRFVNGEAHVDNPTATELRKLPADLGVSEAGRTTTPDEVAESRRQRGPK